MQWGNKASGKSAVLTRQMLEDAGQAMLNQTVRPTYMLVSQECFWTRRLMVILRHMLQVRLPYFCDRYHQHQERYPAVEHKHRYLVKKGQQKFLKYHC